MPGKTKVAEDDTASQKSSKGVAPKAEKAEKKVSETAEVSAEKKAPSKKEVVSEKDSKKASQFKNPFSTEDPLQTKIVNCIMKRGKKNVARRILQDTFLELHRRGEEDPLKLFEVALKNATPTIEVKPKRVGGSVYQIPMEVKPARQSSLCVRWILEGSRKRKGQPMFKRLASEIQECANQQGYAFNKREDVHKMAQANKAFAHLARY